LSGWVRLDGLWLGPAAAALAGILASGGFRWSGEALLQAALLLTLAELGWGNLWWAVAGTDWATLRERWNSWPRVSAAAGLLPYTQFDSPAGRLAHWWADLRAWGRAELWPQRGVQLGAILIGLPLVLVLSAALGQAALLLTLAALSISQMALFMGPADGHASPLAQAVVEIGLPWLGGAMVFGRLTGSNLAIAAGLMMAYIGLVLIGREKRGGIWLAIGQGIMVLTLIALRRPLAAAAVGALYFSQLAFLPWNPDGLGGHATIRLVQWPFLAAMLVAAVAL